jgi:hypothetical protein
MKRYLTLAGIIFLVGITLLFEEKPEVESDESHIASPELTYARMDAPHQATNGNFLDSINLALQPGVQFHDSDLERVSLAFGKDPPPANLTKLQPRLGDTKNPVLTVVDRQLNFELFGSEGFALKLKLTPAYPNPEALIPTRVDPGLGMSIKF